MRTIFVVFILIAVTSFASAGTNRYLKHARKNFLKKNYITARKSYKSAVRRAKSQFTARDFYQMGTAYKEGKKYDDAVKWYMESVRLEYKDSVRVLYLIASSYSLKKDGKMARKYLRSAANHDSKLIRKMAVDKDLAYVRSRGDWKKFYSSIKGISADKYERDDMVGILYLKGKEKGESISNMLCSNGRVVQVVRNNSCSKGFLLGSWQFYMGRIKLSLDKECYFWGLGSKTKAKPGDKALSCDGYKYTHYSPKCGPEAKIYRLAQNQVSAARAGKAPVVRWGKSYTLHFKPLAGDPVQCSQDFKARKKKDMKIK